MLRAAYGERIAVGLTSVEKEDCNITVTEAKCNNCDAVIKTSGNSTNIKYHLEKKHAGSFKATQTKSLISYGFVKTTAPDLNQKQYFASFQINWTGSHRLR